MRIGDFDTSTGVLVIAEIGNNHEGDFGRAREMVHAAAESGAHAVKFQTFRTEHYVSALDEARFAQLKGFELTQDQFAELAELARSRGVMFLSTPFDLGSAEFLDGIVDAFKVASGDVDFFPLLRRVAATDKPMIVSSGVSSVERLRAAVECVEEVRGAPADPGLALLHCVSAYPAAPEDLNLLAIPYLRERFPAYAIGYSDHSIGADAAVVAVGLGARIVEKHFTLEGIESDFRDHLLSAKPAELRELVERAAAASRMLGEREKRVQEAEAGNAQPLRRSVAAARDLDAGHVLAADDLTWVRPGGGLAPGEEGAVIGRTLTRPVRHGEQVLAGDVE
jgi:N,N'-diacetyllegionaminate synthase